jgi:UDP-2-acetamido-3-amino-2,3-dideoxy-glucuronate N-acetyltransferase
VSGLSKVRIVDFPTFRNQGQLTFGQFPEHLPFAPNRLFVISDVPAGSTRGHHAHLECRQILVCVSGSIKVEFSDGTSAGIVELMPDGKALFLDNLVWASQTYSSEASCLVVLASHEYDPADYITDYSEYLRVVAQLRLN